MAQREGIAVEGYRMKMNYTPGPWEHDADTGEEPIVYGAGSRVADCTPNPEDERVMTYFEALANARLIAAAPQLVEALRYALAHLEDANPGAYSDRTVQVIREALAKAAPV